MRAGHTDISACVCRLDRLSVSPPGAEPLRIRIARTLRHHGKLPEAKTCFTGLLNNRRAFERAEGFWGLAQYEDANRQFRLAYSQEPRSAEIRVEWGRLFFERFNPQEAVNLFDEAIKIDDDYTPAYLGLARVAAEGYDQKAIDFARAGSIARSETL